ncbi:hypothetical protein HZH66_007120 [Vespula vulgaris]|uniref:3',5'-cyclic-AMP phosphodiesterase n=1 Tax=Vespula vulgaris TaxID=7454 RepID=A0A834N6M9_VESVU|nr:hypothetical protein HZH66_007120 [Vespula vulgaris]
MVQRATNGELETSNVDEYESTRYFHYLRTLADLTAMASIVAVQFKRMLNKELLHFSESSKSGNQISEYICNTFLDKQQELDLPSLRIEDAVAAAGSVDARAAKKKDRAQRGPAAMSHISGVKRPLTHTNSFTGERVPLHGVETPHEEELGKTLKTSRRKHCEFDLENSNDTCEYKYLQRAFILLKDYKLDEE